jgi:CheY-like chemotaxis protein
MALGALIVDDNPQFLETVSALLERQGMTVVAVASSFEEALRRLEESRPDVLLIDLDLGDESGFDLASLVTDSGLADAPPVILISAYSEDDVVELLDTSSAIGFLSKASLSASRIEAMLRGAG